MRPWALRVSLVVAVFLGAAVGSRFAGVRVIDQTTDKIAQAALKDVNPSDSAVFAEKISQKIADGVLKDTGNIQSDRYANMAIDRIVNGILSQVQTSDQSGIEKRVEDRIVSGILEQASKSNNAELTNRITDRLVQELVTKFSSGVDRDKTYNELLDKVADRFVTQFYSQVDINGVLNSLLKNLDLNIIMDAVADKIRTFPVAAGAQTSKLDAAPLLVPPGLGSSDVASLAAGQQQVPSAALAGPVAAAPDPFASLPGQGQDPNRDVRGGKSPEDVWAAWIQGLQGAVRKRTAPESP